MGPLEDIEKALKSISEGSGAVVSGLNSINEAILKTGNGVDALKSALISSGTMVEKFGESLENLTDSIPGLNLLGGAIGDIGRLFGNVANSAAAAAGTYINIIRASDELTRTNRELFQSNFKLAMQFGVSSEEAQKMTDMMLGDAARLSEADFGFQNFATETKPMMESMASQKISFEKMQEVIKTTAGTYNLYEIAVLQATALGMEFSEYSNYLSRIIQGQGLSVEDATNLLSTYGEIAGRTGLTTKVVADSLTGLGDNFRKMGLNANFGQSFIIGFAQTLKEANLGIENATDLTNTFGGALARLTTDYSTAYVTAMKGGLDLGSGGALGASIQMQYKLMQPETDQAEFGKDLAMAIRETLSEFGGGEITTLKEAAESRDPRLEQAFYTQTQLLSSLYSITSSEDQARVLELLDKIGEAQTIGDKEAIAALGEDLRGAIGGRDKSLSNEEKLNAIVTAQLAETATQTRILTTGFSEMINTLAVKPVAEAFEEEMVQILGGVKELEEKYSEAANSMEADKVTLLSASKNLELRRAKEEPPPSNIPGEGDQAGATKNMLDFFKTSYIKVQDDSLNNALGEIARAINLLSSKITGESPPGALERP